MLKQVQHDGGCGVGLFARLDPPGEKKKKTLPNPSRKREGLEKEEGGYFGICCEMQWKLPPPVRIWSARRPTATRSGKSAPIVSTALRSLGWP